MSQSTESWAALEAEYRRLSKSSRPEDRVECRSLMRQLEKLTTQFLEDRNGLRNSSGCRRGSGI